MILTKICRVIYLRNGNITFIRNAHQKTKIKNEETCAPKPIMDPRCKRIIITGGTKGIGLASAFKLLCAGARKVIIIGESCTAGSDAANLLNKNFGKNKAIHVKANLANTDEIEDAFKKAHEKLKGEIDIVVTAAGVLDGARWEKEIITNIIGTIRSTLLAYKYVGKEGFGKGGILINISGTQGLEPFPEAPTYAASMHAILGLSRSFGTKDHLKRSGVRVVCLCPGFTKTSMLKNLENKGMTDSMGKELGVAALKSKRQRPDVCGNAVVHLVKFAKTGTVWVIEGSRLYKLCMPCRKDLSTLAAQYV